MNSDVKMVRTKRSTACVACLVVVLLSTIVCQAGAEAVPGDPGQDMQRGVCFVGGRHRPSDAAFDSLAATGANWISQTPFSWQRRTDDPELRMATSGKIWWGESDEGLVDATLRARKRGLRTLLKPHIWIRDRSNGQWHGEIDFDTQKEWDVWWERYRRFALHYARLAEEHGMVAYCIGTELRTTVLEHPDRWQELIRDIRKVYGGWLTYSANWYREFEEVPFWDALDYIGIQAYFPLSDSEAANLGSGDLERAWAPHLERIEAVQKRVGKPVIFTEVGYRSTSDATVEPWKWRSTAELDDELQAACYEAMFRTFWRKPWFSGLYIWKWYPDDRVSKRRRVGFTPQGKEAGRVLRRWFSGAQ